MAAKSTISDSMVIFHSHFTSDPVSVASVIEGLIGKLAVTALSQDRVSDIEIILTEATNNIVEHAYGEMPGLPIELSVRQSGKAIGFLLIDRGIEMPSGNIPFCSDQALDRLVENLAEGGFGWRLIRSLAENLRYSRVSDKNQLSFDVTIDAPPLTF